eukprot:CAMPEP_0195523236 /NCGR_PEP_ID=MMETSP0794_2-20130614/22174_1 /TAXON_ID=515487 /ORGANISM="Stephanopyxis turris, Strain CCMP 815" /LENGTH=286 /DNA_ID=CAMNT_0040653175 /DNA_START=33 /DNA_END=893 /DNA_ORIENTATION=+
MTAPQSQVVKSCLNILRRTPPGESEQNLDGLVELLSNNEDAADKLEQRADPPLKDAMDPMMDGKPYILCDHNRDGDSHRSPWSNTYYPPLEDGFKPSDRLRELEAQANEVFDAYRDLYYGKNSISSVYLWGLDENIESGSSFAGCFLIKKELEGGHCLKKGFWNSIHVVGVGNVKGEKSVYKLTSTIVFSMEPTGESLGNTIVDGSLTRQNEKQLPAMTESDHISQIGKFIEEVEIEMRSSMDSLHIQKTKEVVESIRAPVRKVPTHGIHQNMINQAMLARLNVKK